LGDLATLNAISIQKMNLVHDGALESVLFARVLPGTLRQLVFCRGQDSRHFQMPRGFGRCATRDDNDTNHCFEQALIDSLIFVDLNRVCAQTGNPRAVARHPSRIRVVLTGQFAIDQKGKLRHGAVVLIHIDGGFDIEVRGHLRNVNHHVVNQGTDEGRAVRLVEFQTSASANTGHKRLSAHQCKRKQHRRCDASRQGKHDDGLTNE
jgi:hypothetical protein